MNTQKLITPKSLFWTAQFIVLSIVAFTSSFIPYYKPISIILILIMMAEAYFLIAGEARSKKLLNWVNDKSTIILSTSGVFTVLVLCVGFFFQVFSETIFAILFTTGLSILSATFTLCEMYTREHVRAEEIIENGSLSLSDEQKIVNYLKDCMFWENKEFLEQDIKANYDNTKYTKRINDIVKNQTT